MSIGNTELLEWGIYNEGADLRIHIGVATRTAFVFEPRKAIHIIDNHPYKTYKARPTYTDGIITAQGYLVPPEDIPGLEAVPIPAELIDAANFNEQESTTEKGKKAEKIAKEMVKAGLISIVLDVVPQEDVKMNMGGVDLSPLVAKSIQVKCDWRAGPQPAGTGNLYLQFAECNPYKQY